MGEQLVVIASANGVVAFLVSRGSIRSRLEFAATVEGERQFAELLQASPRTPIRLAVDVVDEEFHQQAIPRVRGRARREMLDRRMQQVFLNAKYHVALGQGAAADTPNSEGVLLVGLVNDESVAPWLRLVEAAKAPLVGIFSVSLLTSQLIKALGLPQEKHALVITRQGSGQLRQTYLLDGRVKISRLTRSQEADDNTKSGYLRSASNTRQFLTNAKLMPRNAVLNVHVLHRPGFSEPLQEALGEIPDISVRMHDIGGILHKLGVRGKGSPANAVSLFAQLAARANPRGGNLARPSQRQAHALYSAGQWLNAIAATATVVALLWTGWNLTEATQVMGVTSQLVVERDAGAGTLKSSRAQGAQSAVTPADIKAVVEAADSLLKVRRLPREALHVLGSVLMGFDEVALQQLEWRSRPWRTPLIEGMPTEDQAGEALTPSFADDGSPRQEGGSPQDEWLAVTGEFVGLGGDYRRAHARLEEITRALRQQPTVAAVEILRTPRNVNPLQQMSGQLGTMILGEGFNSAPFELLIQFHRDN